MRHFGKTSAILLAVTPAVWGCLQTPYTLPGTTTINFGILPVSKPYTITVPGLTTTYTYPDGIVPTLQLIGPMTVVSFTNNAVFNGVPTAFSFTINVIPTLTGNQTVSLKFSANCGPFAWPSQYTIPGTYNGAVATALSFLNNDFSGSAVDPVSTATGELFESGRPDLALEGPLPLVFGRYYASYLSANNVSSAVGTNWMHSYDFKLASGATGVTVTLFGGKTIQFARSGPNFTLSSTERLPYQLISSGTGYRFLDPGAGRIYSFDSTGALTAIQDRSGNSLSVTQAAGGVGPASVADGLGRTLTFSYTGSNLAKVQDQSGRSVTYEYTGGTLTAFTDANGKRRTYSYTSSGGLNGLLTAETEPLGNKPLSQTFDTQGRVATQSDSFSNTATFTYTATNNGSTVSEPLGVTFTQAHDSLRNLISQSEPGNAGMQRTYDGNGRLLSVTDRLGNKAALTWDSASGRPATYTDAGGSVTTYAYASTTSNGFTFYDLSSVKFADGTSVTYSRDTAGNVTSVTDQAGKVWKATWNSRGQTLTATNPAGAVTTYSYGNDGSLASVKMDSGDTTQLAYDTAGRATGATFADGAKRQLQFDALDQIVRATDERGNAVASAYDDNGHLKSRTDTLGGVTARTYDTDDRLSSVTDPLGKVTRYAYDASNRPQTTSDPTGGGANYAYDALNRRISDLDSTGKGTTYAWDQESRMTSITDPLNRAVKFGYDSLGRETSVTTPNNEKYSFSYDKMSRLTAVTNPLSQGEQYSYDARGALQSVTLSSGLSVSLGRNDLGNVTGITDPNGNTWSHAYDRMGRPLNSIDPLNRMYSYQYDARQRLTGVALPVNPASASPVQPNVQLTYDAGGNLTAKTYSDGAKVTYTYDAANRLTAATNVALAYDADGRVTQSNGLAIARDDGGRIASVAYAAGKVVTYTYGSRGLLTAIADWVGGTTALAYDDARQLTSATFPNGVREDYTYDADGRLASIKVSRNGTSISSVTLRRDADGKVFSADRSSPQVPDAPVGAFSMGYDQAEQAANQTYDPFGRVVSTAGRTYTWNLSPLLLSYSGSDGAAAFTYDGLGQRISRTTGSTTQNYVINYALGYPSIATVKNGAADQRYYVWLPNGLLLESIEAADSSRHYFHFDENGSTMFLTGDAGAVTDTYAITPFGEFISSTGSTANPFTFAGRYGVMQEGSTGLYYMRDRYYDSALARFISPDPETALHPLESNPYQYARNNPMRFVDPSGAETRSPQILLESRFLERPLDSSRLGFSWAMEPVPGGIQNFGFKALTETKIPESRDSGRIRLDLAILRVRPVVKGRVIARSFLSSPCSAPLLRPSLEFSGHSMDMGTRDLSRLPALGRLFDNVLQVEVIKFVGNPLITVPLLENSRFFEPQSQPRLVWQRGPDF